MAEIEKMIRERDRYKEQLQEAMKALGVYLKELQKMNKYLFDIVYANPSKGGKVVCNIYIDKEVRYKKIEEDNIRLKRFLDKQVTETANLKLETQRTVNILREEFDILLKVFFLIHNRS